ncbi:MAG: hypothetical protein U0441_37275 [Polyangiaceae bacterium]
MKPRNVVRMLLLTALLASRSARAGDAVTAEALFRAGRDAAEKGDFATACSKFEASHKIDPAAGTALNLGDCSEHLGHLATAWQRYQEAADRFGSDERAEFAREKVKALAPRLAHVTITLAPGTPKDAVVLKDGVEIGAAAQGMAVPIDAGDHRVTVRATGHAPKDVAFHIEDGESRTIECAAGPADTASSGAGTTTSAAFPVGFAVGGLGLLGLGAGAVTGIFTMDRRDTVKANCDASKACNPAGIAAASEGRTFSAVSTAAFIGGGVALAAGVTLVILGRPHKASPEAARAGATPALSPSRADVAPGAALRFTANPAGAGVTLTGQF